MYGQKRPRRSSDSPFFVCTSFPLRSKNITDALLVAFALTADFLFLRHIVMMLTHFKQMLLLCIGNAPFTPRTVDPAAK